MENDELATLCCPVPLSSIELPRYQIGRVAARILIEMNQEHKPPPDGPILLPPTRLITRKSTDILAINQPALDLAIAFIKSHASKPIRVDDVVAASGASGRRALERLFEANLNTSVAAEIRQAHLDRARQLLATGVFSIKEVAFMSGYESASYFSRAFSAAEGKSPLEYQRNMNTYGV